MLGNAAGLFTRGRRPRVSIRAIRYAIVLLVLLGVTWLQHVPTVEAQAPGQVMLLNVQFDPKDIMVEPAENVSMRIVNGDPVPHTFTVFAQPNAVVPRDDFQVLTAYYEANEKLVDVWLEAGETGWANFTAPMMEANYPIVCMILGHAAAGMVGTLVVGEPGPAGFIWPLGLVQTILVITLAGTVIFAAYYHLRTTRR